MNAAIGLAYATVSALAVWVLVRLSRTRRRPAQTERPAAARVRTTLPPVVETEPGWNLALADECELIWDLPEVQPGLDRLWQAIRDEQQKGEEA